MPRRNFPASVRKAAEKRAGGKCEGCGCDLTGRRWDVDHIIQDWMGGEPTLDNARVLCAGSRDTCHGKKSASDARDRAKVIRDTYRRAVFGLGSIPKKAEGESLEGFQVEGGANG